jgi:hypothetical protein
VIPLISAMVWTIAYRRERRLNMKKLACTLTLIAVAGLLSASVALADGGDEVWRVKRNVSYPVTGDVWGCAEWVNMSGVVHEVYQLWQDGDGKLHLRTHTNIHGSGLGLDTGDTWTYSSTSNYTVHYGVFAAQPAPVNTSVHSLKLIGQGSAPNWRLHMLIHRTINANGEITTDFSFVDAVCR